MRLWEIEKNGEKMTQQGWAWYRAICLFGLVKLKWHLYLLRTSWAYSQKNFLSFSFIWLSQQIKKGYGKFLAFGFFFFKCLIQLDIAEDSDKMGFFPIIGAVSNSSILVYYLSFIFGFLGSGRSAATGKVLSGFYYLFFIALTWLELW